MNSNEEIDLSMASGTDVSASDLAQMLQAVALLPSIPGRRIRRIGAQTPNNLELNFTLYSSPPSSTEALDGHTGEFTPTSTFEAAMEAQLVHPMYRHRTPREPILVQTPLWTTISPHRNIPIPPQTYITNFVEDCMVRSIEVLIIDHIMPWGTRGFELISSFPGELYGGEVLYCSGDVKGRWTVDDKMFAMEEFDCTLVRILNRQCLRKAAIAVRCEQVKMAGTPEYEEQFKKVFLEHARREQDGYAN
ncbi:hypothetical protein DFH06DRAFT_1139437 [Mycena polygramma]|nr:hypothetical protein DFH06DRAFT_1139437 [Mycena polygramma]